MEIKFTCEHCEYFEFKHMDVSLSHIKKDLDYIYGISYTQLGGCPVCGADLVGRYSEKIDN